MTTLANPGDGLTLDPSTDPKTAALNLGRTILNQLQNAFTGIVPTAQHLADAELAASTIAECYLQGIGATADVQLQLRQRTETAYATLEQIYVLEKLEAAQAAATATRIIQANVGHVLLGAAQIAIQTLLPKVIGAAAIL